MLSEDKIISIFCFVDDLVEGIYRLLLSDYAMPVNIGNPDQITQFGVPGRHHDRGDVWPDVRGVGDRADDLAAAPRVHRARGDAGEGRPPRGCAHRAARGGWLGHRGAGADVARPELRPAARHAADLLTRPA